MAVLPHEFVIKSGEYRPCIVDGRKALFHKWINDVKFILRFKGFIKPADQVRMTREYECKGKIPSCADIETIPRIMALVEFEDKMGMGHVEKVDPMDIQFLDTGNIMHENGAFYFYDNYVSKESKNAEN